MSADSTAVGTQPETLPAPTPVETPAPTTPAVAAPAPEPAPPAAPPPVYGPERGWLMKLLQGTGPGSLLYDARTNVYGWTTASFTPSSVPHGNNNLPVVWNDRANNFLLNQNWLRIERPVITSGTTPSWGYRVDFLYGSDYRWSLPRGLWNSQLMNADNDQNLYGIDPIAHYVEYYNPTVMQGLDVKFGRFFTPFGYESLETVSSPLVSKSYMFNWFPPFTHFGALATLIINPTWTVQGGIVNGNDVYIGDPAQEPRFIGSLKYAHPNKKDVVVFGTSLGRGKFSANEPFNPTTYGLMSEAAGRNNINVFDLIWMHAFNPRVAYAAEIGYGYQTNVPANVTGGIIAKNLTEGTAHWGGITQYLTVNWTSHLTGVTRLEFFDDFEGQRTGFEGLYTAITGGLIYRPVDWLMFRQELRYDYNGYNTPYYNGTRHDLFTAGMDMTVRW